MSTELLYSDAAVRIGLWESLVLVDVVGEVTVPRIAAMQRAYELGAARCAGGTAGVVHLAAALRPHGVDVNEASARMLQAVGDRLKCSVIVVEAGGVNGMALRAILRGLNVVVRGPRLLAVQTLDQATEAIAPHLSRMWGRRVLAGEVRLAFGRLRDGL